MVALLVFIIATLGTVFVVFSRKTLLDAKGPFGDDVFKNPVRTTRAIMALGNYHHLRLFAFDEGRTRPNLLGCLLSRRFPVHASES